MGCGGSKDDGVASQPMAGGQRVGKQGGVTVTRDEQRARAAAAAEARASAANTRGQQGTTSKIKQARPDSTLGGHSGKPNLADARTWD